MSKLYAIIFSGLILFSGHVCWAIHSFGMIADIEMQSRQGEEQKPKTGYLNFITLEQNWSDKNSKFIGQIRFFEFYKKSSVTDSMIHEVFPAEFHYEYNSSRNRWTIGYQSLFLSEGFNLIDTEIFHARNSNLSIFSSPDKLYYTSPGISYKHIGNVVSVQLALLKFERTEQLSAVQKQVLTKTFPFFKEVVKHSGNAEFDTLFKIMGSTSVLDWSFYSARTYEKRINIQFDSLQGQFTQISPSFSSYGLGLTGPVGSAMLRLDYQKNNQRTYIDQNQRLVMLDQENVNLSYDQSIGSSWRGILVLGNTKIKPEHGVEIPIRENTISDAFLNLNYKINDSMNADVSVFERLGTQTQGGTLAVNAKVGANIEMRYGIDHFWMGKRSRLAFLDQEDRIFLGIRGTVF